MGGPGRQGQLPSDWGSAVLVHVLPSFTRCSRRCCQPRAHHSATKQTVLQDHAVVAAVIGQMKQCCGLAGPGRPSLAARKEEVGASQMTGASGGEAQSDRPLRIYGLCILLLLVLDEGCRSPPSVPWEHWGVAGPAPATSLLHCLQDTCLPRTVEGLGAAFPTPSPLLGTLIVTSGCEALRLARLKQTWC